MINVRLKIDQLKNLLTEETNEILLVERGESLLNELRQSWLVRKMDFSTEDVDKLRIIRNQLEAIRSFIEIQEDFKYILTSDDAKDTIHELLVLRERIEGLKVQERISKEVRELHEKLAQLPSSAARKASANLSCAIAKLNAQAPRCRKCGTKMIIREGNDEYFWGCPRFPDCWGRQSLTEEQLKLIP